MTYSHNSVCNDNLKMTTTTATATTKPVRAAGGARNINSGSGSGSGSGGGGSSAGKHQHRRTPPTTNTRLASAPIVMATTPITSMVAPHSNSIASSTNQQLHPLMGGSPTGSDSVLTSGNYFANQRKLLQQQQQQQQQQPQQRNTLQRQSPTYNGGGGAFFFGKNSNNNYYATGGQFFQNNNNNGRRSTSNKQQRTPNGSTMRQSPAAMLGGGFSGADISNTGKSTSGSSTSSTSGRKRRPKIHLQSPIITGSNDLGVGGNISPTHPLLPTVLTHFAGSKCFDAPAPSAVPKPPQHWTQLCKLEQTTTSSAGPGLKNVVGNPSVNKSRSAAAILAGAGSGDAHTSGGHVVKSSKRNLLDDFDSHNLKLLLNVQS